MSVTVNQKLLPAASGPKLARLIAAEEFDSMEDLRVEYRRRVNELATLRQENDDLTQQKRRYEDLYAQAKLANQTIRRELILAESALVNERAMREGLAPKIASVLTAWREHDQRCADRCVAVVALTGDQHRASLCRDLSDAAEIFVSSCDLLIEALHGGDEELLRVVSTALANAILGDVRLVRVPCGEEISDCEPCLVHDCCVNPRKGCPECLREDEPHRRDDMRHEARIAEGLR